MEFALIFNLEYLWYKRANDTEKSTINQKGKRMLKKETKEEKEKRIYEALELPLRDRFGYWSDNDPVCKKVEAEGRWIHQLQPGDRVLTGYKREGEEEVTIEYIETGAQCSSGILVKLQEIDQPLDSSWICQLH